MGKVILFVQFYSTIWLTLHSANIIIIIILLLLALYIISQWQLSLHPMSGVNKGP